MGWALWSPWIKAQKSSQPLQLESGGDHKLSEAVMNPKSAFSLSFYGACEAPCLNKEQHAGFMTIWGSCENNALLTVRMEKENQNLPFVNPTWPTGKVWSLLEDEVLVTQLGQVKQ